jgi:hypothetical protein
MSAPRSILTVALSLYVLAGCVPVIASGYATSAPPPIPSGSSGLPDGRVYEQVSPADKHGYQAGATAINPEEPLAVGADFSVSSPDGNAVAYSSVGPAADVVSSGLSKDFVAERRSHSWVSRSSTGRGVGLNVRLSLLLQTPIWRDYTPDLSHLVYGQAGAQVPGAPISGSSNFYMLGSDPLEAPVWLLSEGDPAALAVRTNGDYTELLGMSPDASIVYIAYQGGLLPQDGSRLGWGLYEYRNGKLSEAGVMPDGSIPASGAMPPATAVPNLEVGERLGENNPASLDNQLSEDATRVLFVSSGQLYVHKIEADGSERSVLVSASQLSGHLGEAAPNGVALFENLTKNARQGKSSLPSTAKSGPTYAYASPDGSHVFFQSQDQLTNGAPGGSGLKVYDFGVDTGLLEYLPGVTLGGIVTATKDGSSFVFVNDAGSPPELDMWSAGPDGGSVSEIAQLPGGGFVGPGRLVAGNSVLVFQALAPIVGFNNASSEQVYRYDIKHNELACVSCPPAGVVPAGSAFLSPIDQYEDRLNGNAPPARVVNDARSVSSDGKRIFFGSPDPLVGRDTNGKFDVYEWEDGKVFLVSSGTSPDDSTFLDNSESGNDVFFATSDELVQGDSDRAYDVYDARIPRPGDSLPPNAVPCSGDVCQGPPSIVQLLGAPPSATFNGAGNVAEESSARKTKSIPKRLSPAQNRARALRACHKLRAKRKRATCEKQVRKRYPTGAAVKSDSRRGR